MTAAANDARRRNSPFPLLLYDTAPRLWRRRFRRIGRRIGSAARGLRRRRVRRAHGGPSARRRRRARAAASVAPPGGGRTKVDDVVRDDARAATARDGTRGGRDARSSPDSPRTSSTSAWRTPSPTSREMHEIRKRARCRARSTTDATRCSSPTTSLPRTRGSGFPRRIARIRRVVRVTPGSPDQRDRVVPRPALPLIELGVGGASLAPRGVDGALDPNLPSSPPRDRLRVVLDEMRRAQPPRGVLILTLLILVVFRLRPWRVRGGSCSRRRPASRSHGSSGSATLRRPPSRCTQRPEEFLPHVANTSTTVSSDMGGRGADVIPSRLSTGVPCRLHGHQKLVHSLESKFGAVVVDGRLKHIRARPPCARLEAGGAAN